MAGCEERWSVSANSAAFCRDESVSPASFYRWRSLLGTAADAGRIPAASALSPARTEFVDLGPLTTLPSSPSFELHLDLGGGLMLHLARH